MAGKTMAKEIFCWQIDLDGLEIYTASSKKGAVGVGISLGRGPGSLEYFMEKYGSENVVESKEMNTQIVSGVRAACNGQPIWGKLSLDIQGTQFQMETWEKISLIPFGETRTYGEVALMMGRAGGARAIGQAMNRNPLPLIYP